MKYLIKHLIVVILGLWSFTISAQETKTERVFGFYFDLGWTIFGPTNQLANHMVEHGFDHTTGGWGYVKHPNKDPFSPSIGIGLNIGLTKDSKLGLYFNASYLKEVSGANERGSLILVNFYSYYVLPRYTKVLKNRSEYSFGLPIMFNNAKSRTFKNIGLLMGYNLWLKESKRFKWSFGADLILTYNNRIGPYGSSLPSSNVNFSHINIKMTFDFMRNSEL